MIYRLQYSLLFQKHTEKVFEGSRKFDTRLANNIWDTAV